MMSMIYNLRVDIGGKPQVPLVGHASLADAKRAFEEMKPTTGVRATIVEYDGERAIRTVCVGHPRDGAVVWRNEPLA